MTIRYEYVSDCCGHNYSETRLKGESLFFPTCNKCGSGKYKLVKETKIADEVIIEETPVIEETPEIVESVDGIA